MQESPSASLPSAAALTPTPGTVPATAPVHQAGRKKAWQRGRSTYRPGRFTGWIVPLLFVAFMETGARLGYIPARLFPPPSELLQTISQLALRGELLMHVAASVTRVLTGFIAGSLLAVATGLLVGLSRRAEALLEPTFQALRAIPSLAWIPLLLLWLGIDETPKIVLIAIGAFFPVYLNLVAGIRDIDYSFIEVGIISGLDTRGLIRHILLPASLPYLFAGLRNGVSLAWMFLVAAELIAATRGIGYLLSDGRETGRPDLVLAAIIVLAVLGKLSDGILRRCEQASLRWRDARLQKQA